jgi:hypothetical protein
MASIAPRSNVAGRVGKLWLRRRERGVNYRIDAALSLWRIRRPGSTMYRERQESASPCCIQHVHQDGSGKTPKAPVSCKQGPGWRRSGVKLSVSSSLHQQHLLTLPASFWANRADQPAAVLAGHLGEDMFVYREPHWGACLTACTDVLAGTEAGNCASSDGALLLDNRDVIRLAGHP